jgi:hypothetical protein
MVGHSGIALFLLPSLFLDSSTGEVPVPALLEAVQSVPRETGTIRVGPVAETGLSTDVLAGKWERIASREMSRRPEAYFPDCP